MVAHRSGSRTTKKTARKTARAKSGEPYRPRPPAREFEEICRDHPDWPQVLAEGDSWFAHPIQWNILFHLLDGGGYAIRRLASIGDELADMIRDVDHQPEYLRLLERKRFHFGAVLFSGGGNDLLGSPLPSLLRNRAEVGSWRDVIDEIVLKGELEKLRTAYRKVIDRIQTARPGCHLLAHGYDRPYPRNKGTTLFWGRITVAGPWMHHVMNDKGLVDPVERHDVCGVLIDRLNDEVLAPLANDHAQFHHIDLRGTLQSVGEWDDEIHPKSAGFKRMAARFRVVLDGLNL